MPQGPASPHLPSTCRGAQLIAGMSAAACARTECMRSCLLHLWALLQSVCLLACLTVKDAVQLAVAGELRHIAHPAASLAEFDSMITLSEPGAEPMQL